MDKKEEKQYKRKVGEEPARRQESGYGGIAAFLKRWKWLVAVCAAAACLAVIIPLATQPKPLPPSPIAGEAPVPTPTASVLPAQTPAPSEKQMLSEMAELYAQNPDIAGWLKIDGTAIDYPVMYTPEDGEYYLYRNFEREEDPSKEGCLFIDKNCSLEPRSTNLLLHGHNMKNGSMFHALLGYKDETFYQEHKAIRFDTLYEEGEYEVVCVFLSQVYKKSDTDVFKFYRFYDAATRQQFDEYVENIKKLELYDTGITPVYGDELITLSTCEYSTENGRIAVVARKIKDTNR